MSSTLLNGVVESITRTSIIVMQGQTAVTLSGAKAAKLAPSLKLGDKIEFDKIDNPETVKLAKEKEATTPRKPGASPSSAMSSSAIAGKSSWA